MVMGHHAKTKEELVKAIENDDYDQLLNKFDIKKGDFFYIPSGTIHAICKGSLIYEAQQSSDITYRVYDYHRKDKDGNERQLHVKQSIDVTTVPYKPYDLAKQVEETTEKAAKEVKKTAEKDTKEVKKAAPKTTAKKSAAKKEIKTEVVLQYGEKEVNTKDMIASVKKDWTKQKHKISEIKSIELYVKPEDYAVYYVINGEHTGKVWL